MSETNTQEQMNKLLEQENALTNEQRFSREVEVAKKTTSEILTALAAPELPAELDSDDNFKSKLESIKSRLENELSKNISDEAGLNELKAIQTDFFNILREYKVFYSTDKANERNAPSAKIVKSKFYLSPNPKE